MERKQKQSTLNAPHVKRPTILGKDVGKELAHTSNQRETKLRTTLQRKTQTKKKNPQITTLPHQKHQPLYLKTRIQKTVFATTPNLPADKNQEFCFMGPFTSIIQCIPKVHCRHTNCHLAATDGNCLQSNPNFST